MHVKGSWANIPASFGAIISENWFSTIEKVIFYDFFDFVTNFYYFF